MSTATPPNLAAGLAKIFEIRDVGFGDALQQFSRGWSLQRQRRDLLGDVFNLHVESDGVLPEPAQVGIGRGPAITILFQPGDGAVVNDLAVFIAPAAVDHLIDRDLVDVARDDAIDEARGIAAGDHVLVERRHVDQRRRIADGVVLVLMVSLIDTDRIEPRPLAVIQALTERKGSFVNRGSDGHADSSPATACADYTQCAKSAAILLRQRQVLPRITLAGECSDKSAATL